MNIRPVEPANRTSRSSRRQNAHADVVIRPARMSDARDLMRLIGDYYRYDHIRFVPGEIAPALDRLLRRPSLGRIWIMREGRAGIGYVILTFNYDLEFGGIEGLVTDLYIDTTHRKLGLGRKALEVVDEYCRSHGIATVELQVEMANTAAQAFYERIGFTRLDRVVMTRAVQPRATRRRQPSASP
jgi:ribosomal protein S18 acetylase RimI-like enzyme